MSEKRSIEEIIGILKSGDFASLNDTQEDALVEVKGAPYRLSSDEFQRHELAKDVSALANANGGIILIGFRTTKDALTAVECIDLCRPFDLTLIDVEQYRKTLQDWIYPPLHSIDISCYPSSFESGKGVCAIVVPEAARLEKPYVVTRTVEPDGKIRGNHVGYYERFQDAIPLTSPETLRNHLRDGMRFAEVLQRLNTIEVFLGNLLPTETVFPKEHQTGLSDLEIQKRIAEAKTAVDRSSRPDIIFAATSINQSSFPELFHSQSAPVVSLLEHPPILRRDGFAVVIKGVFAPRSEINNGRSRRIVAKGSKLVELWQDGALVAVGQGDEDLLCWFTRSHQTDKRKPGLPIRNFVLGEVTLNFINLAIEVFKNAKPTPKQLKFFLVLDNMTEDGVPCTLSSASDKGPIPEMGETKSAPGASVSSDFVTPVEHIDVGIVAYHLLGGLYAKFGFNYEDMPYIQHDQDAKRVTPESLIGKQWKQR